MTIITNPACSLDADEDPMRSLAGEIPDEEEDEDGEQEIPVVEEDFQQIVMICDDYLSTPPPPWFEGLLRLHSEKHAPDVEFLAGYPGRQWRFPGHRSMLAKSSPVFKQLFKSNPTNPIVVDNVDRTGFEQLMRYLYGEVNLLDRPKTARLTLDAAFKFMCVGLVKNAVRHLDELMDPSLALELLPELRYMCSKLPGAASAPHPQMFENSESSFEMAKSFHWCDSLAENVLRVIDNNADTVLQDERFIDLVFADVSLIVRRETLRVSSELVIIDALARWSTAVCLKNNWELTFMNRRRALGTLAYSPRYLLLDPGAELNRALAFEQLKPFERELVVARARNLSAPVPERPDQEHLLQQWAVPRYNGMSKPRVPLNQRDGFPPGLKSMAQAQAPVPEPPPERRGWFCLRRCKKAKTGLKQPKNTPETSDQTNDESCCSCFGNGILRAFICLFD